MPIYVSIVFMHFIKLSLNVCQSVSKVSYIKTYVCQYKQH
ncbi:hypothetical protein BN1097_170022 [Clostridioides difficile]|uniref:Uncharacterized protein n=1 Tax=Clostridioides difficile TaxID=1496 RepID=A0A069A2W0_CLODI|nr:hypothetical protein BN1097_170022 [Clostridioides difficile]